jgi:hypothetical protein
MEAKQWSEGLNIVGEKTKGAPNVESSNKGNFYIGPVYGSGS